MLAPLTWYTVSYKFPTNVTLSSDSDENISLTEYIPDADSEIGPWSDDDFQTKRELSHYLIHKNPHDAGHVDPGTPCLIDTCPHTCMLMDWSVNGLGQNSEIKLVKIIEMMIDQKIYGCCLQETWQLGIYVISIRGYTVFHHSMGIQLQVKGCNSTGVTIILEPAITHIWARADKLASLQSSPH